MSFITVVTAAKNKIFMQQVLAEIPTTDREEFLHFCVRQYSRIVAENCREYKKDKKTKFKDFIYLVATLYESKALNIYCDMYDRRDHWGNAITLGGCFFVDKHGFITSMDFSHEDLDCELLDDYDGNAWDLSGCHSIGHLTKLEELSILDGCAQLPDAITKLKNLKHLSFWACDDLSHTILSVPQSLLYVEKISIQAGGFQSSPPSLFFEWIGKNLPKLSYLHIENVYLGLYPILETLCNLEKYKDTAKLYTKMKKIGIVDDTLGHLEFNTKHVQNFFSRAVPKFLNIEWIEYFSISDSDSCSFSYISSLTLPSSIHTFYVYEMIENVKKEDEKRNAINACLTMLENNTNVISLGCGEYDPRIKYALLQNQAGRNIIERSRQRRSNNTTTTTTIIKKKTSMGSRNVQQHVVHNNGNDGSLLFPLSILAYYLERAYHESSRIYSPSRFDPPSPKRKDPTGTYYLLQQFASDVFVAADEDRKDHMYDTELEKLQAENIDLKNQLLRSLAEQENNHSIARNEVNAAKDYAIQSFAESLLEVSDNLDRVLESVNNEKETTTEPSSDTFQNFIKGIELTNSRLTKAFKSVGVEAMDVGTENDGEGLVFNPEQHQAVMEYVDPTKTPGTIGVVMKKGYTLHGRVLRPTEVGVIKK